MSNLEASFSILGQKGVMAYILKGTVFTLIIALIAVVLGIVIGSVLALCRNYCTSKKTKIFGMIATVYIEVFRNTPLLLWIFICLVFCPCPELFNRKLFGLTTVETKLLFKAAVALILFTSSVIAEIIRGGLNSIAHGQFEAGHAQGFNVVQVMIYIILPQAYRNVIPTLLSQVITTIKDSSYLANVATIELMARDQTAAFRSQPLQWYWQCKRIGCICAVWCSCIDLFYHQLHTVLRGTYHAETAEETGTCDRRLNEKRKEDIHGTVCDHDFKTIRKYGTFHCQGTVRNTGNRIPGQRYCGGYGEAHGPSGICHQR